MILPPRLRALACAATAAIAAAALLPMVPAAAGQDGDYIVVYNSSASVDKAAVQAHGRIVGDLSDARVLVVHSSDPAALEHMAGVMSVGLEGRHFSVPEVNPQAVEAGAGASASGCATAAASCGRQWDLERIHVPQAWQVTSGSPAVKVAVLDTGVNSQHEEVGPNYNRELSRSFVQPSPSCPADATTSGSLEDFNGHGTWTSLHIAGRNGPAMTGIAPSTTLVNVRVLGACGSAMDSWIFAGMLYSNRIGAQVINASLGTYLCGRVVPGSVYCSDPKSVKQDRATLQAMSAVVEYVTEHGSLVVAAAGNAHGWMGEDGSFKGPGLVFGGVLRADPSNDMTGLVETPAGLPGAIAVAATSRVSGVGGPGETRFGQYGAGLRDQLANYSTYGERIDVSAPGGARNFNLPSFDCGSRSCARLGVSAPGATDNPGDFGAFGTFCSKCYGYLQGTSMAAPQVSGVAALALAAHPGLKTSQLAELLRASVTPFADLNQTPAMAELASLPTYNFDLNYWGRPVSHRLLGAGLIDAGLAVRGREDEGSGSRADGEGGGELGTGDRAARRT